MLGLYVDAKGRETAVVGRAELIFRNVFCREHEIIAYFLCAFDPRIERINHPDKSHLLDAVRIAPDIFANALVNAFLIFFTCELHEKKPAFILNMLGSICV